MHGLALIGYEWRKMISNKLCTEEETYIDDQGMITKAPLRTIGTVTVIKRQ